MLAKRSPFVIAAAALLGGCLLQTTVPDTAPPVAATASPPAAPPGDAEIILPPGGPTLWVVPTNVTYTGPQLPSDTQTGIQLYQPYMDQFSWQMFIALSWPACPPNSTNPACPAGQPDTSQWIGAGPTGDAPTVWEQWANADEVFRHGGAPPLKWGEHDVPAACQEKARGKPVFTKKDGSFTSHNDPGLRGYMQFDAKATGPLVDQKGRWARFESYINKVEYDYIVQNTLYSKAGQEAFAADKKNKVDFPPAIGETNTAAPISIEVKAVWKVVDGVDKARYHTAEAVWVSDTGECQTFTVGLVAMHIGSKIARNPTRLWSTFEHVDNLCRIQLVPKDKTWVYAYVGGAFCNAECKDNPTKPGCAPNQPPPVEQWKNPPSNPTEPGTALPTQVVREKPIPLSSIQLTSLMTNFLGSFAKKSVWQNYELISTQWVMPLVFNLNDATSYRITKQGTGPAPQIVPQPAIQSGCDVDPYRLGVNKGCPGLVVAPILANSMIETYAQSASSCTGCHEQATTTAKQPADFSFLLGRAE